MDLLQRLELHPRPLLRAALTTIAVAGLVALGSRGGRWLDPALLGYLLATLFASFGIAYRYWDWVDRPPTWMFFRHSLKTLLSPKGFKAFAKMGTAAADQIVLQRFIRKRSIRRWGAHFLLSWGCLLGFAITIPLVFGWVRFTSAGLDASRYQAWVMGIPAFTFPLDSLVATLTFHALDIAAVMVIAGCALSFLRRRHDEGDTATQRTDLDLMPLLLLIAVSATGIMLTVSETYLQGRNFGTIAYLHELTVILLLLSLPFGKLFHIVQRPAQIGVKLYKEEGEAEGRLPCKACGTPFIRANQRRDLEELWDRLDLKGATHADGRFHHLDLCPRCKRRLVARSQAERLHGGFDPFHGMALPTEPIPDSTTWSAK